ncbi:hypothetical protein [Fictibacillus barbaricus]|uniref:Uncharacterized protein n=1 Tax=Fictibacillus barbaricus TaxID=182136 RepID=A0ABU1U4L3_9BACL|nr:hypothetical protein [Fictibacillus barbaricus]MDR7074353.1 hypothetical protein [Fictibacillus barbaricus]
MSQRDEWAHRTPRGKRATAVEINICHGAFNSVKKLFIQVVIKP